MPQLFLISWSRRNPVDAFVNISNSTNRISIISNESSLHHSPQHPLFLPSNIQSQNQNHPLSQFSLHLGPKWILSLLMMIVMKNFPWGESRSGWIARIVDDQKEFSDVVLNCQMCGSMTHFSWGCRVGLTQDPNTGFWYSTIVELNLWKFEHSMGIVLWTWTVW